MTERDEWSSLSRWFLDVVRAPSPLDEAVRLAGGPSGPALDEVLTSSECETAAERLGVYRHAYFARLEECLVDDFPAVRAGYGQESFSRLARDYATAFPSGSYSLNTFGARFPAYLEHLGRPFWAELARLEWSLVVALHSAATPSTLSEDLKGIDPETATRARFSVQPEAQLLELRFDVNAALDAYVAGGVPPVESSRESPTAVLVGRHHAKVWRLPLGPLQRELFVRLRGGATLLEAVDGLDVTPSEVERWFADWAERGVISGLTLE